MQTFIQFAEAEEDHIPVKIRQLKGNPNAFGAYHKNKRVGAAIHWNDLSHGKPSIYKSEVHPDYRKKGVATALYKHIEKHIGKELHPASSLSDDAFHFWNKYRPSAVKDDLRHHTKHLVGKDVEHPRHGPAKITSVGSGVAIATKPNGNTYALNRKELVSHGHLNEDAELGKKIKKAMSSKAAYQILDGHHETSGSTWQAGGCGVMAHGLHPHLKGSKLVDVHNKTTGNTEHVAVHHGDHVYDANGATPHKDFIKKFRKREMIPAHHDLELTDHNPARAHKSGIVTHPATSDAVHKHLKSML